MNTYNLTMTLEELKAVCSEYITTGANESFNQFVESLKEANNLIEKSTEENREEAEILYLDHKEVILEALEGLQEHDGEWEENGSYKKAYEELRKAYDDNNVHGCEPY